MKKLYAVVFAFIISSQLFSQNSVLVNFGSNGCNELPPSFSLIGNPLGGSPTLLANCDLSSQLPSYYSVFVAYNPKNNKVYVADVRTGVTTSMWVLDMGLPSNIACPTIPVAPDYQFNYASNLFEFDNNGDVWSLSNYNVGTGISSMDKFDAVNGTVISTKSLQFPQGNFPNSTSSGDITILPNGRMFATLGSNPSRLYEVLNYGNTPGNATAKYLQTLPDNFYGLAYLNGQLELTGTNFAGDCYYYDYEISTNTVGSKHTFQNGQLAIDNTSITPAVGVAKQLAIASKINSNTAQLTYELYVQNLGNTILNNVNVSDNIAREFGAGNISNLSVAFVPGTNEAGLLLNPAYNGNNDTLLLQPGQVLPNNTGADNKYFFKVRISFTVTNLLSNKLYLNSALGSASFGSSLTGIAIADSSNNGPSTAIDPNFNGNATETGENVPTPFNFALLPVHFINVSAAVINKNSSLVKWQVATPMSQAEKFGVEFSTNGATWGSLGQLKIMNNNQGHYQFTHNGIPTGKLLYRIRQTDKDGSSIYSKIVTIFNQPAGSGYAVYPNPARNLVQIAVPQGAAASTLMALYDATGRKVLANTISGSTFIVDVSAVPNGNYIIRFENGGEVSTQKLTVLH